MTAKTSLLLTAAAALVFLASGTTLAADNIADFHAKKGMDCTTCHKTKDEMPTTDTCTACHPKDAVVEATKNVKPENPHTSPHYGKDLDCYNCHVGHEKSVDFCDQCHSFGFKVP